MSACTFQLNPLECEPSQVGKGNCVWVYNFIINKKEDEEEEDPNFDFNIFFILVEQCKLYCKSSTIYFESSTIY